MGGVMMAMSNSPKRQHTVDSLLEDPAPDSSVHSDSPGFGDLPESCIAHVLCLVSPKDIARLACTSRVFREAALSDVVWQIKLPRCYTEVFAGAKEAPPALPSKKAVYEFLCHDVLLHEGHEAIRLDMATGQVFRNQGARAMAIVWGNDQRYWDWLPRDGSSFAEVAYLKAVCWLEVQGGMECTLPVGRYTLSWRLSFAETPVPSRSYIRHALGHVYGWSHTPVIFAMNTDDNQHARSEHYLDSNCWEREQAGSSQRRMVDEKWMEFDVGDFIVQEGEMNSGVGRVSIKYSLIEIKGGHWKSGMFLDGVVIRPSHLKPKCLGDRYLRGETSRLDSSSLDELGEVCISELW